MAAPAPCVIVTRPCEQAAAWVAQLRAAGCAAAALPLITIAPPADPRAARQAWQQLADYQVVIFVSPAAARGFFRLAPPQSSWPAATLAAAPGPGSAQTLRELGLPDANLVEPAAHAEQFDSESLWATLSARLQPEQWRGQRVLIVAGGDSTDRDAPAAETRGRPWLAQQMSQLGAQVDHVMAYCRLGPLWNAPDIELLNAALNQPDRHLWLFSSSDAIGQLRAELAQRGVSLPAQAQCLVTHPRIGMAARAAGFAQVRNCRATVADVIQALGPESQ